MSKRRNLELEKAIVAEPSVDAFLVYGDWLLEQGDLLGELITVQAALAKEDTPKLRYREKKLLAEHEQTWLGHFSRYPHTWNCGFLESIKLPEPGREDCVDVLELVAARFLRVLEVELLGHRSFENAEVVSAIVEVGLPPLLTKLVLAPSGPDCRAVDIGAIRALWPRLANVEDLTLRAGSMITGDIVLPRAKEVWLATNASEAFARAIAGAVWPVMTSLKIELTAQFAYYQAAPIDHATFFEPLLELRPPLLRSFAFNGHFDGDLVVELLGTSPLRKQLTKLDLSRTALTDAQVERLATDFKHLLTLDVSNNQLGPSSVALLQRTFNDRVVLEGQSEPMPEGEEAYPDAEEDY